MRNARKHLGWYVDELLKTREQSVLWRSRLCRQDNPAMVISTISDLFEQVEQEIEVAA